MHSGNGQGWMCKVISQSVSQVSRHVDCLLSVPWRSRINQQHMHVTRWRRALSGQLVEPATLLAVLPTGFSIWCARCALAVATCTACICSPCCQSWHAIPALSLALSLSFFLSFCLPPRTPTHVRARKPERCVKFVPHSHFAIKLAPVCLISDYLQFASFLFFPVRPPHVSLLCSLSGAEEIKVNRRHLRQTQTLV